MAPVLQILNLHPGISEEDLKELFLPFGNINYLKVVRNPVGQSTGGWKKTPQGLPVMHKVTLCRRCFGFVCL